jgi:hypothetical protein
MLPVLSFHTFTKSMIAAWPLFNEYKLHIPTHPWLPAPYAGPCTSYLISLKL